MISFNATLLLQAVHFIIAYGIVRYLLLKPIIAAIYSEDSLAESLQESLQDRKAAIEEKHRELLAQWEICKRYFSTHAPLLVSKHIPLKIVIEGPLASKDKQTQQREIASLAQQIVSGVDHVR